MNSLFSGGLTATGAHWLDWLYGPRRIPDGGGSFAIRGVRIDHDIVRDIVLHLQQHDPNAGLFLLDPTEGACGPSIHSTSTGCRTPPAGSSNGSCCRAG